MTCLDTSQRGYLRGQYICAKVLKLANNQKNAN